MSRFQLVPPSPGVMSHLYETWIREGRDQGLTFKQFLEFEGCCNHADHNHGMDDGAASPALAPGLETISIPTHVLDGPIQVKVLLVDFDDRPGTLSVPHYENLLFSKDVHPTGSMRDYFAEVSLGRVDVQGSVHGWLRLPEPYSFYANQQSGLGPDRGSAYPRDARRMAEHAVIAAIEQGVTFSNDLDIFGDGTITALFIVHAGEGAEVQRTRQARLQNIWSHKWQMVQEVQTPNGPRATRYLTVPNDCDLGVCAHELGHLAFQWEDFYDPNGSDDGKEWDGSGDWDLMAGGSYNGNSRSPAHPAALHKMQHDWIDVQEVSTPSHIELPAFTDTSARAVRVTSPHFRTGQYLLLENRASVGFDAALPGEGLLVWRVDESKEQFAPTRPALLLIQADGRHDLEGIETPMNWNAGDDGDPFPGSSNRTQLGDSGNISTSFPDGHESGIELRNIEHDPQNGAITCDVVINGVAPGESDDDEPPSSLEVLQGTTTPNLVIPDDADAGIESKITLESEHTARSIAVAVEIAHSYIGDVRVEIEAPTGQRALLHNRAGGSSDDLRTVFRSNENEALTGLLDAPIAGDWTLHVSDHAARDIGTLKEWGIAIVPETLPATFTAEVSPALTIPDDNPVGIGSTIHVPRAGIGREIEVEVDITHTYKRDLRVELVHPSGARALLHNRTGGSADDLKKVYQSADSPELAALVGQAIRGDWSLRVSDLESRDRGMLNRWALKVDLAPGVRTLERVEAPALPIPDNDPLGVGLGLGFEESGTVQAIEFSSAITHSYIGDLRVELIAPSGARALLHDRSGGRTSDLNLDLDSSSSAALGALIGQPSQGIWVLRVTDLAARDQGVLESCRLRLRYV